MLSYDELLKVLEVEGVPAETYTIEYVQTLYGELLSEDKLLELIDIMVFVSVDMETPLYDILEFIVAMETENEIDDNFSCAGIIMDNIIDNLAVSNANCERLFDLIKDSDIVSAYNNILSIYGDTIPAEMKDVLLERAHKLFDPELLLV